MSTTIRTEQPGDTTRIREIHLAAFPTALEADLVDALRDAITPSLSYVAERDGTVVGHVLYTPVTVKPAPPRRIRILGLGPMAIHPAFQNQGIGSALADASIAEVGRDADAIVVLGHPEWYPRFGFMPASQFDLSLGLDVAQEAFLALETINGALMGISGTIHYHSLFRE